MKLRGLVMGAVVLLSSACVLLKAIEESSIAREAACETLTAISAGPVWVSSLRAMRIEPGTLCFLPAGGGPAR